MTSLPLIATLSIFLRVLLWIRIAKTFAVRGSLSSWSASLKVSVQVSCVHVPETNSGGVVSAARVTVTL